MCKNLAYKLQNITENVAEDLNKWKSELCSAHESKLMEQQIFKN